MPDRDAANRQEPSLDELRARERREAMEGYRPGLEADARRYGIAFSDDTDSFALSRAVHHYQDELRRPELERRAARLGVPTHTGIGPFRKPRRVTDISLDCYREEDRQQFLRRYGYV